MATKKKAAAAAKKSTRRKVEVKPNLSTQAQGFTTSMLEDKTQGFDIPQAPAVPSTLGQAVNTCGPQTAPASRTLHVWDLRWEVGKTLAESRRYKTNQQLQEVEVARQLFEQAFDALSRSDIPRCVL